MIAESANADKETVRKILYNELNMKNACAKLVPKNLTPDQKLIRQQIRSDFLETLDEEPELMETSSLAMKPEYSKMMLKLNGHHKLENSYRMNCI